MHKLSKREKSLLVFLGCLIVAALYYNFFLKGFLAQNAEVNEDINNTRISIRNREQEVKTIGLFEKKINGLLDVHGDELSRIMVGRDNPEILDMLVDTVHKYVKNPHFAFSEDQIDLKGNSIVTVEVRFKSDKGTLVELLNELKEAAWVNRVIEGRYTVDASQTYANLSGISDSEKRNADKESIDEKDSEKNDADSGDKDKTGTGGDTGSQTDSDKDAKASKPDDIHDHDVVDNVIVIEFLIVN